MNRWPRVLLNLLIVTALAVLCLLAMAAVPRPGQEVLRRDLERILARSEYRTANTMWLQMLLIRAIRRLLEWWNEHVAERVASLAEHAPILYWTIVGVLVLLGALLIYHIYMTMRSAFGTRRRRVRRIPAEIPGRQESEPQALLDLAEAAARAGAFPEALRYLYLALIHHLDRRDVVRYDISHTNQEYLRQARKYPVMLEPLRAVTRLADRAWYGHYRLGLTEYEQCRELVETVWQEAEHAQAL